MEQSRIETEEEREKRLLEPKQCEADKPDPWKHRSRNMSCQSCMWFVEKQSQGLRPPNIGRCRRHAPTMNGYPVVFVSDWCGDHKLDENK